MGTRYELLHHTIASLQSLKTLKLIDYRDGFLQDLAARFSRRKCSTLKKLVLEYTEDEPIGGELRLPGLVRLLGSKATNKVDKFAIVFRNASTAAVKSLVSGLSASASISQLFVSVHNIARGGTDLLGKYLGSNPKNLFYLELLNCQSDDSYFQQRILQALYKNTTITILGLDSGFCDNECSDGVGTFLVRNTGVTNLSITSPEDSSKPLNDEWIRKTASSVALASNSSLKSLYLTTEEDIELGPLCDALLSMRNSRLEEINISMGDLLMGSAQAIEAAIAKPEWTIKELDLSFRYCNDNALYILEGTEHSTRLKSLFLNGHGEFECSFWEEFATILPKVSISELTIMPSDLVYYDGDDLESLGGKICRGMEHNTSLQKLSILEEHFTPDSPEQRLLQSYCTRNKAAQAAAALTNRSSEGNSLALSTLPDMLKALQALCSTKKEFRGHSSTLLFAALTNMPPTSHTWASIKNAFCNTKTKIGTPIGSSSTKKKRKRARQSPGTSHLCSLQSI